MNKIFKYGLLLLAAGFAFTACSDEDEATKSVVLTGPQTYFSNEMASVVEISKATNSFTVTLNRQNTDGELSVPLKATMPDGSIFTVPTTATFADGSSTADIVITYDPADLVYGEYTDITLEIGDKGLTTPYGPTTYSFKAGVTEFVDWDMGTYREALVDDWGFGIGVTTYEVPIQKSIVREGVYRLVNPYGEYFPYNAPGDYGDDSYMVIDASDPNYVWVDGFDTSMNWGYGIFSFYSMVYYYINAQGADLKALKTGHPEFFGTLENGVITMPANSFLGTMSEYKEGQIFGGFNASGMFAVALPGSRIADFSVEYVLRGYLTAPDGQDYVLGTAFFGDDVARAYAGLATDATASAVLADLQNGKGVEVFDGEEFSLPFDASGKYYVLIMPFDAEGTAHDFSFSTVQAITPKDQSEDKSKWVAQNVGDYYYEILDDTDAGLTLYADEATPGRYKIDPWGNKKTLVFTMNENNIVAVPEQPTGISGSKGELYCSDVTTFTKGAEEYASLVSKFEDGVITIYMVYYNDGESYIAQDTYTLTGVADAEVKAVRTSSKKLGKVNNQLFRHKLLRLNKHLKLFVK